MLFVWIFLALFPVAGGFYLMRGRVKSLNNLQKSVENDVQKRLMLIAGSVNGNIVDGPALETLRGRMMLLASQAPANLVIDLAKFTGPVSTPGALTVVRVEDAKKVIATKGLRPVTLDPALAESHRAFASDEEQGRKWMNADLAGKLKALDAAVRGRTRLQVLKAEELKAFYDGCVAVLDSLNASAGT